MPLPKVNYILAAVVLFLGGYIIISPIVPEIEFMISAATDETKGYGYQSSLAIKELDLDKEEASDLPPPPTENTLVIPSAGIDGKLDEGYSWVLDLGIWRRPNSSTPDRGGNTVFVAHRYLYTDGPNTFYHLPKTEVGDTFIVFWEGKEYNYEVISTEEVPATATYIEENTEESIVTLYTCTPLWTAENRFVVRAKLIGIHELNM